MNRSCILSAILMTAIPRTMATRAAAADSIPTLAQQLAKEDAEALAKAARAQGDAEPRCACLLPPRARLHALPQPWREADARLGPDLAKTGKEATDVYLVESILLPSKVIKKGFETVVITTKAGKTLTGLLAEERADAVVLRDAAQDGKLITIAEEGHRRTQRQGAVADAGRAGQRPVRPAGVPRPGPLPDGDCREGAGARPCNCVRPLRCSRRRRCRSTSATSTTPA